ncbi:Glutathione S-transferase Mu 1 [Galemys pyrenaicus]|uniref:Glutathione S-transferase n=1 Tax=Galemys pyrenaicus TaxID=202257 RepID=A0A8J6DTF1_GALPY|nr:Glutathione S-transferase Mu 1 [Galemys pyrenaicus]
MAMTLGYWDIRGLAHAIRLLLEYTGAHYEEKLYTMGDAPDYDRSQWLSEKFKLGLDFPNVGAGLGVVGRGGVSSISPLAQRLGTRAFCSALGLLRSALPASLSMLARSLWTRDCVGLVWARALPYLIDGAHRLTQSNAILRYLARKHNLCGETEEERIRIDILENQVIDTRRSLAWMCYSPDFEKLKPEYLKGLPDTVKQYSQFLGKRPWFAGDEITYVDFLAYDALDRLRIFQPTSLDAFPNLKDFIKRFEGLKNISAYMKSSHYLRHPMYLKNAVWGNK